MVNQRCNPEYYDAPWSRKLEQKEFLVIHTLCVHPRFARNGYAKELVNYGLGLAKTAGMKSVRLDVLEGNIPAEKLYPSAGFEYVDTVRLFYEDTGWTNFKLYEFNM